MLQRLLKHPKKLGISLNFWDFLLIILIVVSGISLFHFLGRENLDVISSRELLRLTSTPHIRNEAPDAAVRGRPLKGSEIIRASELLDAAKYKVYTGIYVANNFSLDLEIPSFSSKGYIWMRWGKSFQDYLKTRDLAISDGYWA